MSIRHYMAENSFKERKEKTLRLCGKVWVTKSGIFIPHATVTQLLGDPVRLWILLISIQLRSGFNVQDSVKMSYPMTQYMLIALIAERTMQAILLITTVKVYSTNYNFWYCRHWIILSAIYRKPRKCKLSHSQFTSSHKFTKIQLSTREVSSESALPQIC